MIKKLRQEPKRNTRKLKLMKCGLIVLFAIILSGMCYMNNHHSITCYEYDRCTSLWDLAERHCPNTVDKRKFIRDCKKLNAMDSDIVYENRLYQYPVYE